MPDLFKQRVFSVASGDPHHNNSTRLAADPVHKMLLDCDPLTGLGLASQPTMSRIENVARPRQLHRIGEARASSICAEPTA